MSTISKDTFTFHNLSQFPHLFHAVSTRKDGSMKGKDGLILPNIEAFVTSQDIPWERFLLSEQVHGGNVIIINDIPSEKILKNADGIITTGKNIFLGVVTADCLPLLFYDPKRQIVGAVHAGYKGLLASIIGNTLEKFRQLGSNTHDIWVGIGPAIGVCCYEVPLDRIELFNEKFPSYVCWYQKRDRKFFLDLRAIAQKSLVEQGVLSEHLEISDICTIDHNDRFFSYRADGPEKFGEFVSVIGIT
ncbi:MAG: peptidoglycan editing factor PgeF [Patescibacteria group bacterium]